MATTPKNRILLIAHILLVLFLTQGIGWAAKYPVTVKDSRGKTITIPSEPKRIISLTPSNTEILYALGLESRVVGVTNFCNYPAAARRKTSVGDRSISTAKVISLKPDLVLAHGTLNDSAIRAIERHGIRVVAVDAKTISQTADDIRLIGRITNREPQSVQVANRITAAAATVKRKTARVRTKPQVLVAVQADPLWAAGPQTFIDEMIAIAGGVNLAAEARPGFHQFSLTTVVSKNPDVIIGTTRGDKQVFTKGVWNATKAARSGRIHEADADLLVRPGPRLADGILAIAKLVHPNAFD